MNKVFKTIWNASLGAWVAVSEAASGQKKSSNKLVKSSVNAVATIVIGVAAQTTIAGWAPTELGTTDPTKLLGDIGPNSIAIGSSIVVGEGKASALGMNAIAIGKNATANNVNSMAVGTESQATGPNSTSFGSGSVSSATGTVAIGTGASAGDGLSNGSGQGAIAIGASAVAKNQGSIAIGKGTEVNEDNAIAIGSGASSAKGAVVVGVGSTGVAGAVSLNGTAIGTNAVSIGTNSDAKYNNAVAVGYKAKAALSAVGIGDEAFAYATDSIAIGRGNTIDATRGINSVAIGQDNIVNAKDTFVLGSNINTTVANSVILGAKSQLSRVNTEVNNPSVGYLDAEGNAQTKSYNHIYAGAPLADNGAVSVGGSNQERQIQNVAAGRVNAVSTDAVNGSQLYAVLSEVNDLDQKSGWNVAVNDGEKTLIKDKDDTVNFKAGSNINLSKANRADGADIEVNLADSIALTNAGSVVIAGAAGGSGPIQLQQGNVSFGNNQLHDVAAGTADNDAVNLKQLKDSSWTVKTTDGSARIKTDNSVGFYGDTAKNISVTQKQGTAGTDLSIELANDLDLTADGSVKTGDTTLNGKGLTLANGPSVTTAGINAGGKAITNVAPGVNGTDAVNVNQLKNSSFTLTSSNATGKKNQQIKAGDTIDITTADDEKNITAVQNNGTIQFALAKDLNLGKDGSITVGPVVINNGGINAGGTKITNLAPGTDPTDAVNKSQLDNIADGIGKWTIAGKNATGGTTSKEIKNGTVEFASAKNINVITEETTEGAKVSVELAKDLDLTADGSVKIGDTTLNGKGLTLANGPSVTQAGIYAGDKVVTGVADGLVADNSKEAINGGQLKNMIDNDTLYGWSLATADKTDPTQVKNSNTVGFKGDKNLSVKQEERKDKDGKVVGTDILVELEKDLDLTADGSVKVGDTLINSGGLSIAAGGGKAPIIIQQGNVSFGGNQLKDVAAGTDDTDAVNVKQLKDVTDNIGKWTIVGTDGEAATSKEINNSTVEFASGKNITVTTKATDAGAQVSVALNKDIDLGKDGSISIGGINIQEGNVSVGGNTINNVGKATKGDQAVNLDQLTEVTGNLGWNVKGTDSAGKAVTEKITNNETVEFSAGKNINVNTSKTTAGANITVELAKDLNITGGSLTAGTVVINDKGINAGGNKITNVANGVDNKDAVNVGQLKDAIDKVGSSSWDIVGVDSQGDTVDKTIKTGNKVEFKPGSSNIVVNTNATDKGAEVSVDLAKDLSIDSINVGGTVNINKGGIDAGNTVIKNVANGKSPTDAVNVSQLEKTNTYVTNVFGGGSSYNPTTQEFTGPTYNVAGGSYNNVGDALEAIDDRIDNTYNYMDNIKKKMSAGIASAMALEAAPFIAGKYTYAAGTAYHDGEGALGLTLRKTADNGRWSLTGGVAAGTEGDPSVRVGVSGIID